MSTPFAPRSTDARALLFALLFLIVGLLAATWLYGFRAHLRALGGIRYSGYTPVNDFALRDSLPALEGGLSNLEAFKSTASPIWRADAERSIWLSDSLGALTLEFVTQKTPFDSVTLFAWTTGGTLTSKTFRAGVDGREVAWSTTRAHTSMNWIEVVTAYVSDPPFLSFQTGDSATCLFARAEGTVYHVVSSWYLNRREKPIAPDTAYVIDSKIMTGNRSDGELALMVRGKALAVVNPGPHAVTLRLLEAGSSRSVILHADSMGVSVYRNLLRGRIGTLLAYTDPGVTFPVFRKRTARPRDFFVLRTQK